MKRILLFLYILLGITTMSAQTDGSKRKPKQTQQAAPAKNKKRTTPNRASASNNSSKPKEQMNTTIPTSPTGPIIESIDDEKIHDVVEHNAQFPGGDDACYKWLSEHIKYPAVCQAQGIQGRVFVSFVVNKDGSVVEVKVMRSPDENLSKEAERVVKQMPKWKPATQGNKPVRSRFNLPIMFRLNDDGITKTFYANGVSFQMVEVQGGTFTMGATPEQGSDADDDEKPVHSVTLSSYYIGKYEVTQELWQAVMGSNPSNFKGARKPVDQVSWHDCQTFISKLNSLTGKNFRLPTEAEWEYAARGGSKSRGYKYSGSNDLNSVAWYDDNSGDTTHDVGTKQPNELGIYDMSGNAWEWCNDWFGSYSSNSQANPTGPSSGSGRAGRGGCWGYDARGCRSSFRDCDAPVNGDINLGLRLALSE